MKKKATMIEIVIVSHEANTGVMFEGDLYTDGAKLSVPESLAKNLVFRERALTSASQEGKQYLKAHAKKTAEKTAA